MTHTEVQQQADARQLEHVHFQFNVAQNTGREFEVGYVSRGGKRVLFCKRQSWSAPDAFYLCNEFRSDEADANA